MRKSTPQTLASQLCEKNSGLTSVAVSSEKNGFPAPRVSKVNIAQPWTSFLQSLCPFISSKTFDNAAQQAPLFKLHKKPITEAQTLIPLV